MYGTSISERPYGVVYELFSRERLALELSSNVRSRARLTDGPACAGVNHSCEPNTRRWTHHGTLYACALRDIKEGEEFFCSYLTPDELQLPVHARRALLESKYKFVCMCPRCVRDEGHYRCVVL